MNDKELLKYAAKAAGYVIYDRAGGGTTGARVYSAGSNLNEDDGICWKKWRSFKWDPLNDDGDALRLSVQLKLNVEYWIDSEERSRNLTIVNFMMENHDDDALAATRRAIVRAAAEIGESMESN